MTVLGSLSIEIVDDPAECAAAQSPFGKPFIRLKPDGQPPIDLSCNIVAMIGGAARGAMERWQEANTPKGPRQ